MAPPVARCSCPRFGPVTCLAALAPVTRRFLVLPLVWQDKIGTEALLDQNDRLKGGGNARRH